MLPPGTHPWTGGILPWIGGIFRGEYSHCSMSFLRWFYDATIIPQNAGKIYMDFENNEEQSVNTAFFAGLDCFRLFDFQSFNQRF